MKKILTVLLILMIAFAFIGCKDKDDDSDDPKNQTATRTLAHGVGTVTVQGYMTNAQWNGVPDKIQTRLNNRLNTDIGQDPDTWLDGYIELFGRGVVYIVEPNPVGYNSYKLTGDGKTVYIALDKVDTTVPANVVVDLYQSNTMVDGVAVH